MIYVTGDIHGVPVRLSSKNFPEQKEMTKDDYVIICGDFGLVWDRFGENADEKYWLDWLDKKPFTTLFVSGNHENFNRLEKYPIEEWNGGKVQRIRPSVIHLMRGEIFEIDGQKIFAFGGASSHDIDDGILDFNDIDFYEQVRKLRKQGKWMYRVKDISWWEQELPTEEEMQYGLKNLTLHHNEVDFIISHCAPQQVASVYSRGCYKADILTEYFNIVAETVKFKKWLFGHYHDNQQIMQKFIMLYEQIIRIN